METPLTLPLLICLVGCCGEWSLERTDMSGKEKQSKEIIQKESTPSPESNQSPPLPPTSQSSTSTSNGQNGPEDSLTVNDLMDPYKYSLKHIQMRSEAAKQPLGMKTEMLKSGVLKVVEVTKGGIADKHGIEVDSYVLCVNGRECKGEADDLNPNDQGLRITTARKRRYELGRQKPFAFLGRYVYRSSCDYFITRMNLIKCSLAALQLVKGLGDCVCLGLRSDRTAIDAYGLRVGDVIVAVDYVTVRALGHCDALLKPAQNDFVDLTIARPQTVAIPVINIKESTDFETELALSSDDSDVIKNSPMGLIPCNQNGTAGGSLGVEEEVGGDPTLGVPKEIPPDVKRILKGGTALNLARKIIAAKPRKTLGTVGVKTAPVLDQSLTLTSQDDGRLVKINKEVEKSKLKKGPQIRPPPQPKKK